MLRELTRVLVFPVLLLAPLAAATVLLSWGWDEGLIVFAITIASTLPILVFQRLLPYEDSWRGWGGDLAIDIAHAASMAIAGSTVKALLVATVVSISVALTAIVGTTIWPTHWPLFLQLPIALLISELGTYTLHRLSHENAFFWRIHALHHSSERLYMMSSSRNHPFSVALAYSLGTAPLIALGAHGDLLVMSAVFTTAHGLLQHANIDYRHGWFNWVFATADLHRWHHSEVMHESCTNYGSNLIFWDVVFGTRFLPEGREIRSVGLGEGGDTFPTTFWGHLLSPFTIKT